ncbi:MAG: hypothetical protein P8X73_09130 [Ignavibacteriaceae bacterium]
MKLMYRSLHFIAISGNIIFVFWILMNGINEGFEGTLPEIFSFIGLIVLLLLKAFLLYKH